LPEYPDITVYIEHLAELVQGCRLEQVRLANPFFLRTFDPPIRSIENRKIVGVERMGKRIVFRFEGDLFLLLHLMVGGRLHWRRKGSKIPAKKGLAAFDFPNGTLQVTEAGSQKRASLHLLKGCDELERFDPSGLDVFEATFQEFRTRLVRDNHTLKRSLTDPRIFSGIGNAYSDEILHRAKLSPLQLTVKMTDGQIRDLYVAAREVLQEWTDKLRKKTAGEFPDNVTAFHEEMAVHGRFGKPCPICGSAVQRIRYASNETDYCPECQTGGKLLADRVRSRLLKEDRPRSLDELEERHNKNDE
jgi:formamidopyrimidine-DNA glycosylase